jgi:hypothetical protein
MTSRAQAHPVAATAPELKPTVTDLAAAVVLAEMGRVRYISAFGEQLIHQGIVNSDPGKRYTRQGFALIAGKSFARLRRLGLAEWNLDGWVPTRGAKRLTVTDGSEGAGA